jgi:hypothetical protein
MPGEDVQGSPLAILLVEIIYRMPKLVKHRPGPIGCAGSTTSVMGRQRWPTCSGVGIC